LTVITAGVAAALVASTDADAINAASVLIAFAVATAGTVVTLQPGLLARNVNV
jgi:hypothetical protein